jgi:hypothetical protein
MEWTSNGRAIVAKKATKMRSRPGNWSLAKAKPSAADVITIEAVVADVTTMLFSMKRPKPPLKICR